MCSVGRAPSTLAAVLTASLVHATMPRAFSTGYADEQQVRGWPDQGTDQGHPRQDGCGQAKHHLGNAQNRTSASGSLYILRYKCAAKPGCFSEVSRQGHVADSRLRGVGGNPLATTASDFLASCRAA